MIEQDKISIAIDGLGYVGLPLAAEFSKCFKVTGYDASSSRISELKNGKDGTGEVEAASLKNNKFIFSDDPVSIINANVYTIFVPTPVDKSKIPDLKPLQSASRTIGEYLKKDEIVIFESTVYPGATEGICVPILEIIIFNIQ